MQTIFSINPISNFFGGFLFSGLSFFRFAGDLHFGLAEVAFERFPALPVLRPDFIKKQQNQTVKGGEKMYNYSRLKMTSLLTAMVVWDKKPSH